MLKHAKTSTAGPSSDPAKVGGDDWNANHVVDSGGLEFAAGTAGLAIPAAGKILLHGRTLANHGMPSYRAADGMGAILQASLARNKVMLWSPSGNNTGIALVGTTHAPSTTTATQRNVAGGSLLTSLRRIGSVSAAAAGSSCGSLQVPLQWCRGYLLDTVGVGGFLAVYRFGCSDQATVAGARSFVGMTGVTTKIANVDPSSLINIIGVGTDSGDANLQIMHNDASGVATKVDLGPNFPDHTLSADVYELALFSAPASAEVGWQVTRLNTGHMASGTISTNLPTDTKLLAPQFWRNNGPTALAVEQDIVGLYIETDN
ncbi:hypothetical protein ACFSQU_18085 [Massilia sp. GCM10020059]|uniref:Uncharacterized protein n=1 Tax=Massilia agrisoli TaxID=2892444 RepID=A0ABS8IS27_9BURK|nr:hypothetical protein [Massilia agrisoli]MCC6071452.1 hypothetical protein [Massilia agrisoli]